MLDKLNPDALAEHGDDDPHDPREGVQPVTPAMIQDYVTSTEKLPVEESARAFADWLHESWNANNENGELTNGQVIEGALAEWRGV